MSAQWTSTAPAHPEQDAALVEHVGPLVEGVRRLAMQSDLVGLAEVAAETACGLVQGARARCYFVHAEEALLWTGDGDEFPVAYGLAGAAATSRRMQAAVWAASCPSYCREVDDPDGDGSERLVAMPIVAPSGELHAVVVVARNATLAPFSWAEVERLGFWAQQVAPLFHMFHVEGLAEEAHREAALGRQNMYREEAVDELVRANEELGVLLGRLPTVLRHAHWLALFVVVAAFAFVTQVKATEYASGPAFIVSAGRHDVAAAQAGVVELISVVPGDTVAQGQPLLTFDARAERAELVRAQADLDRAMLDRLRTPSDPTLEDAVAAARADWERAQARVEQASVRAPRSGRVADVRVEEGRAVVAGQVVVTLADDQSDAPRIRALVPGRHRPALEVGQRLNLDIDGFANATQHLTVTHVGDEVLGAQEVQRVLGPQVAGALAVQGPVTIVEARLDDAYIETDGRSWALHEGMVGKAEIAVRHRPIAFVLFPELEDLLPDE